jgi:1,2-phenylacetyl-CoA epoxidase PaaB subunit
MYDNVEGLAEYPLWKVVVKDQHHKVYARIDVYAPTAREALVAAKREATKRWGYPNTLSWNARRSSKKPVNVVNYVS